MAVVDLLRKKPFGRITADGYLKGARTRRLDNAPYFENKKMFQIFSQSDFLQEYYPSGHRINSEEYYPDRVKYEEVTDETTGKLVKRYYKEKVLRVSVPFQIVIVAQQLVHSFGNNTKHTLISPKTSDNERDNFFEWRMGWLEKNSEIALYEFGKSLFITGDAAIVYYLNEGKLGIKTFSYLEGDTLYPHYDSFGELDAFARRYYDYAEDGRTKTEWVEVYDKTYVTRYRHDIGGLAGAVQNIKQWFGLGGYVQVDEPTPHGFDEVPIVYYRLNGPVWADVQNMIENWELSFSSLGQNNAAFGFPIMVLKSDEGAEVESDMYGAVKAIKMGSSDSAEYLKHDESPESVKLYLEKLSEMIFLGSFVVKTPEVKSGDMPGVAIKLIYSPSLDKAILNKKDLDACIDKMQRLFTTGYGIEMQKITAYRSLKMISEIEPYVHQNNAELISNIVQAVNGGFLSRQTASQINPYATNNEYDKVLKEKKEEQQQDLLYQLKSEQQAAKTNPQEENKPQEENATE